MLSSLQSSQSPFNFLALLLLLLLLLFTSYVQHGVNGLGNEISSLPLYEDTSTHCDELIELHKWKGTCCSLNVTEGNGCILNVRNGYCEVKGQVWTLNYESTSDIPCPPSEYTNDMLGIKTTTQSNEDDEDSGGGSGNSDNAVVGMISMAFFTVAVSIIVLL
jgi:hypothetical protein